MPVEALTEVKSACNVKKKCTNKSKMSRCTCVCVFLHSCLNSQCELLVPVRWVLVVLQPSESVRLFHLVTDGNSRIHPLVCDRQVCMMRFDVRTKIQFHYTNPESRGIPSSACSGTSSLETPVYMYNIKYCGYVHLAAKL